MLLNDDSDTLNVENNTICSCYDTTNKKHYKEYISDFINYNYINNTEYKVHCYIYESTANINSLNYINLVESKVLYYKNTLDSTKFYLEFVKNINFDFEKGTFKFNIFQNNNEIKTITFKYTLNKYNYNSDIIKVLFTKYHIYLYLQKNKLNKLYISKVLFQFLK